MARLVTGVSRTRRSSSSLSLVLFLLVLLLLFANVARSAKITFIRKNGKTFVIKTGDDDDLDDDDDLEETDGEDSKREGGGDSSGGAAAAAGAKKSQAKSDESDDSDGSKRVEALKSVKSPESVAAAAEAAAASALAAMAEDPLVEKYKQEPLDPGSWRTAVEMPLADVRRRAEQGDAEALGGVARDIPKALMLLERSAEQGFAHAHSALGFLHASGYGVPLNQVKAFLHHTFAANGGSIHSKMALGFAYLRQQEFERAAALYADVAAKSMAVNSLPGLAPLIETVHLSAGGEESLEATRGHRGEADETIQFIELQASRGAVDAIRTLGTLYYWGARGMPRDHVRAFGLMKKAAEMDDPHAMVTLGEMLTHGVGVKANYGKAMEWFKKAHARGVVSALNGVGYLHSKGLGVPQDYHKAVQNFLTAARKTRDVDALYNLGMSHLRGQGVRRNPSKALQFLQQAVEGQHVGAMYQMGKMHLAGTGVPKNVVVAARLLKAVAERGPWGVMLRWAHACFMSSTQGPSLWSLSRSAASSSASFSFSFSLSSPLSPSSPRSSSSAASPSSWPASCDVGTSLMLYSRAAELGYDVAQGNAAWLLDKVVGNSVLDNACVGPPRNNTPSTPSLLEKADTASQAVDGGAANDGSARDGEGSTTGQEGSAAVETSQADEAGGDGAEGEESRVKRQQEQQGGPSSSSSSSSSGGGGGGGSGGGGSGGGGGASRGGWRRCSEAERHERSHRLWQLAAEQGSVQAALLLGDAFFYGRGQARDLERAAEAYWRAREKGSAHAMFNLGFMHEHGMGLPRDLHLAKRFYDQVLDAFPRAVVPVRIALFGLWLRMQYGHYPAVSKALDLLPEIGPITSDAIKAFLRDETNAYIATLIALLLAVLFLRSQRRQQRVQA
ncbi:hypothetical protein CLOM_g19896 [Closterium sp. NIES-68]|nr:hypothetical protein CLOM_g19896 [Closterium sp. NIES-68]